MASSAVAQARTRPTSAGSTSRGPAPSGAQPGRRTLAGAVLMVVIGSFMPWISTSLGSLSGAGGPGIWTFYAAILGLAGVLVPIRRLAAAQAAVLAAVAVGIPVWQLVHVLGMVGLDGWRPGPGLVLVLGGGILAGKAVWLLLRRSPQG